MSACAAPIDAVDAGLPAAEPAYVVDLGAFEELAGADDPFSPLVPGHLPCTPPAYVIEQDPAGYGTLEIRTDVCNYLTLHQPSLVPIARGDTLQILLWHNTLATQESAQAVAAIRICDQEIWSVEVPIPSPAQSFTPSWQATKSLPAGCPVLLHIHNHGANAWRFGELTRSAKRPTE